MFPILFEFWEFRIYSDEVFLFLAIAAAALWGYRYLRISEIRKAFFIVACMGFGLAGARLMYMAFYPDLFFGPEFFQAFFFTPGMVWYGALIGVAGVLMGARLLYRLPLAHLGDATAQALALLLVIKRIGCFLAGCCYGTPTDLPWGVRYPDFHAAHGTAVHPVQLYESLLALGIFGLLRVIDGKKAYDGQTALVFFLLYGASRFITENLRAVQHIPLEPLGLTTSQIISLLLVAISGGWLVYSYTIPQERLKR